MSLLLLFVNSSCASKPKSDFYGHTHIHNCVFMTFGDSALTYIKILTLTLTVSSLIQTVLPEAETKSLT